MSLNITYISNQYKDFAGSYVKAYEVDTLTPKAIYFDDLKLSGAARIKIDREGFLVSDGGARIIAHIEGYYDIYFFPTKEEADNNDITNAIIMGDRLVAEVSGDTVTKASETEYGTAKFTTDQQILIGEDFPDNLLVSEAQMTTMGEISAQNQKATESDLTSSDDTKWLSSADSLQMIANSPITDPERPLDIGDVILEDEIEGKNLEDYLIADGGNVDPVIYPDLAQLYGAEEGIQSFDSENQIEMIQTGINSSDLKIIKISNNLWYGVFSEDIFDAPTYNMLKSADGINWTVLTATIGFIPTNVQLAYDGTNLISILNGQGQVYSAFRISDETMIVDNVTVTGISNALPISSHYNTNLSKFIFIYSTTGEVTYIVSSTDLVTLTNETNFSHSGVYFRMGTFKTFTDLGCNNYYNGKYYFDDQYGTIQSITEDTWVLTEEYDYTATLSSFPLAGCNVQITETGGACIVVKYTSSGGFVEIVHSDDLITWNLSLYDSGFGSLSSQCHIIPFKDYYMFKAGNSLMASYTKDFITEDYITSFPSGNGSTSVQCYMYNENTDVINEYTAADSFGTNAIYLNELYVTTGFSAATTPDMSYESFGGLRPYIKAK